MEDLVCRLEKVTSRLEKLADFKELQNQNFKMAAAPYVVAFEDILNGSFKEFFSLSNKIGGDVKNQVTLVKDAFQEEKEFLVMASKCQKPGQPGQVQNLVKNISKKIEEIQSFKDKHRGSQQFNHLSTIAESIPALGWVLVSPTPGPYVKEMSDAGQFYSNRVLKDFKEKDKNHVDWVKSWIGVLSELQSYVKKYHTTGLEWNKKGGCITSFQSGSSGGAPPPPPGLPPPPAPTGDFTSSSSSDDNRAQLFADLNKGENITRSLKKVSDDMKTHKNPALRTPGAPVSHHSPQKPGIPCKPGMGKPQAHKPKLELEGKKWIVEHYQNNHQVTIGNTEMKQTVYIYKCTDSTITIKGKVNAITLDSCKKTGLVFDESISSLDFVNCQSVKAQVLQKVPTINIDKTDGCMIYLSKNSLSSQILSAKSSEMNVLVPDAQNEFNEFPIPEQYRTQWDGKKFVTVVADVVG